MGAFKFHLYQVLGSVLSMKNDKHSKIYRIKLWATTSKFWYFLKTLKKTKKSNGQLLAINEESCRRTINFVDLSSCHQQNPNLFQNLDVQGDSFELESGERCIRISNAVIERNQKQWENFIIGQFYGDAPSRGVAYAIAIGIWSKRLRDISVSRLSDSAFLFKIPSPITRRRVLSQGVWHFDGETMFVAKWEPGLTPELPELTSFPVWLEFRDVPLQFYNEESLFRIASLVGKPCALPSKDTKSVES